MDPKRSEPIDGTNHQPFPAIVSEAFDLIKPQLEVQGKKFILIVFDRNEFINAAAKEIGSYGIDAAASCGRKIALRVIQDYIRQEEKSQTELEG